MTGLCLCLAAGMASYSAFGAYVTNGSEYAIGGSLLGDQVHPHLAINTSGGFVVWEDNVTDAGGLGVSAVALDSTFSHVQGSFRVNHGRTGDKERPRVALCSGGGAVFVWQGGRQGFQHIYARFLSSSNTWLTGDVQVNSVTNRFQTRPALATLANGNVVIVWASFNQAGQGSMQDIYGQLLSPAGQKIGSEFAVNQFTTFNQRNPAVSALSTGGFVVAWVSEQQNRGENTDTSAPLTSESAAQNQPSVEIYGRLYDANGAPLGNEFILNADSSICASPALAAGPNGGFIAAWCRMDVANRTNNWDIVARTFSSESAGGPARVVNTYLRGDQLEPQVSALGSNYLVVWTSLHQDGSREGIFGQFLNADGSASGGEFRVNATVINSQRQPAIASDNSGRFLVLWSSYVGGANSFDISAQRYAAPDFVTPGPGAIAYAAPPVDPFDTDESNNVPPGPGSTNVIASGSDALALGFPLPPVSSGGSGFPAAKGTYNGLFYGADRVSPSSSGYFSATVTEGATYSARLIIGARSWTLSGSFTSSGVAAKAVSRAGQSAVNVQLQLDLAGGDRIHGTVQSADGAWSADLVADRLVFDATRRSPYAGNYTFIVPGNGTSSAQPAGDGFGTVKIDAGGKLQFSATLADGTKVTQKSAISREGVWPLYASLYGGSGSVIAWVKFDAQADSDLGGSLIWTKPAGSSAKYYPAGFTNKVWATGARHVTPASGARLIDLSKGNFIFSGGGLSRPFTNGVTLASNNKMSGAPPGKVTASLTTSTGLFKGKTVNPETGLSVNFQGALFEKANIGVGFFLGANQSGQVYLCPAP